MSFIKCPLQALLMNNFLCNAMHSTPHGDIASSAFYYRRTLSKSFLEIPLYGLCYHAKKCPAFSSKHFYLVATSAKLSPCAIGGGNSDLFSGLTGFPYLEETSIGEFMLAGKNIKLITLRFYSIHYKGDLWIKNA